MIARLFAHPESDAGDAEPASCVEDATTPPTPLGLGDIAVFIGGIEGEYAKEFVELNQEHIWRPPLRIVSQEAGDEIDDEEPESWRGDMYAAIPLDGTILCHSFRQRPMRPDGWYHGALTKSSMESGERPRDILYPLNAESGISSSAFRIDYALGPNKKPAVRITPLVRYSNIHIHIGTHKLKRQFGQSVILDQPAKIYLNDDDDCLGFWMWPPTRNAAEQKVFQENLKAFYDRGNCLDEAHFPGIVSAGGSTQAPSRAGYETRTGLTGTEYQRCGATISNGAWRDVFPVKIISQPRSNLVVPEQTAMQKQQFDKLQSELPELKLVAKEMRLTRDDSQSKQEFREKLEKEFEFVKNHPHPHINAIYDIAYKPRSDDRPWIIEERQEHCLDDKELPFPINKEDIAMQLICGLKHYHDLKNVHRDIKPGNILLQPIEYLVEGLVKRRWVPKYTDNGEVASTDRLVKGLAGTPWFCAPEVLIEKRCNEMADIFSLGVLFLCMFAEYDPERNDGSGWWPNSSSRLQRWMGEVDQVIEKKCPPKYQALLRGMLLRNPKARWPVDKCLDFMLNLDQSQMRDRTYSIGPRLPWTTEPLTEEQIHDGRKRKYEVFERDSVEESDDGLPDDARTIIPAAPDPLPDGSANVDEFNDSILENNTPETPKLSSCATQLPVTPCPGFAREDALPSAACTPVVDNQTTGPATRRVVDQPEVYNFDVVWDWADSGHIFRSRLAAPRAATSAFARPVRQTNNPPSLRKPALHLGITDANWGFNLLPQTSRSTKTQQRFMPSQQLTKNMTRAILRSGGEERPEDFAPEIDPSNGDESDSEAETEFEDSQPEAPSDTRDEADSEAETEREFVYGQPEAPSFRRAAQTKASTKIDLGKKQRETADGSEQVVFPQPSQRRQCRVSGTIHPNVNGRSGPKYDSKKEISWGTGWGNMGVIR